MVRCEVLILQKKKLAKQIPFKLDLNLVYPFLQTKLVDTLKHELTTGAQKPFHPRNTLRAARSFFDTILYSKKVKATPGHSKCLAFAATASTSEGDHPPLYVPDYNIKKVNKVAPDIDYESMTHSFSLDSRKLRCCIVEDVMFANPETVERILSCISIEHPALATTWLPRYITQHSGLLPTEIAGA
jgi:hypothetical protein